MNTKGLRISDIIDGKCIPFSKVLEEIQDANQFSWALLWLDVTPIRKEGKLIKELEKKVKKSENGFYCNFELLVEISKKIFQEIEVLIVGCQTKKHLHRYKEDQEMYETCDFVIEIIDGGCCEVFSKDHRVIGRLAKKYSNVESLKPDFQKIQD